MRLVKAWAMVACAISCALGLYIAHGRIRYHQLTHTQMTNIQLERSAGVVILRFQASGISPGSAVYVRVLDGEEGSLKHESVAVLLDGSNAVSFVPTSRLNGPSTAVIEVVPDSFVTLGNIRHCAIIDPSFPVVQTVFGLIPWVELCNRNLAKVLAQFDTVPITTVR